MSETATALIPHLICRNAIEALEFYQKAFGATVITDYRMPEGKLLHAALGIKGAVFYVTEETPEYGGRSPLLLGGSPVTLHLQVPNCDVVFQRAVDAGCTVVMPMEDMFWGDRFGMISDPCGHQWSVATTIKVMTPEETAKAAKVAMSLECPEAVAA